MEKTEFKNGDPAVLKSNPKLKYTIVQIDIDNINARCIDFNGKEVTLPLISLKKPPTGSGWVTGVYD